MVMFDGWTKLRKKNQKLLTKQEMANPANMM